MNILLLGPTARNQRIHQFLSELGHNVAITAEAVNVGALESAGWDWIISNGYAPILSAAVVRRFPGRILNLHASYLPFGKGIGSLLFSVLEGVTTGVSIHLIDEGIDTGDVLFRRSVEYQSTDTLRNFYHRLLEETEKLFLETWERIATNDCPKIPQASFNIQSHCRNRVDSERLMDLLPDKWDTTLGCIREMGSDFFLSEAFWSRYESDLQQIEE